MPHADFRSRVVCCNEAACVRADDAAAVPVSNGVAADASNAPAISAEPLPQPEEEAVSIATEDDASAAQSSQLQTQQQPPSELRAAEAIPLDVTGNGAASSQGMSVTPYRWHTRGSCSFPLQQRSALVFIPCPLLVRHPLLIALKAVRAHCALPCAPQASRRSPDHGPTRASGRATATCTACGRWRNRPSRRRAGRRPPPSRGRREEMQALPSNRARRASLSSRHATAAPQVVRNHHPNPKP